MDATSRSRTVTLRSTIWQSSSRREASGSKVFNIPKEAWDQMSAAERWAANQKFLDKVIAAGDVLLASPITDGGTYARELDYMLANGYLLSPDGWKLLAP